MMGGGFLCGSILFSKWLPQLLLHKDICAEHEDGNPGAANVFSSCGVALGLLCLLMDLLKGFLPVLATRRVLGTGQLPFALVLMAPVLGHAIAPLNHFRGGKCIATSFGVLLALLPQCGAVWILAASYILFSTVLKIGSHRVRSILAFGVFGVASAAVFTVTQRLPLALGCVGIALVAISRHRKPAEASEPAAFSVSEQADPAEVSDFQSEEHVL